MLGAGEGHAARGRLSEARERLDELGLTVPVDACDADDLPRTHAEADAAHRREAAVVLDRELLDLEEGLARRRRLLVDLQHHFAPDHQACQSLLRRALARNRVDELCRGVAR